MKILVILIPLYLFLNLQIIFSQDTNTIKYLPLKTGNLWVYQYTVYFPIPPGNGVGYDKYRITGTSQINGKTFYNIQHTHIQTIGTFGFSSRLFEQDMPIRIDSFTCNIYRSTTCGSFNESYVDSLKSKLRDSSNYGCYNGRSVCDDTALYNIFGNNRPSKNMSFAYFEGYNKQKYVKNIGLVQYMFGQVMSNGSASLKGCIIDGVVFGDTTTIVGIQQISSEIPFQYSLMQNYPNPFNPSTKIEFSVLMKSLVKLEVLDLLGRKVQQLYYGELNPGIFAVEWNASNYAGGIYFYQLSVDNQIIESKKMVLVK